MTTKTWNFNLDGQPHTLTFEHGVFSGKRSILLDGQLLEFIPRNLLDSGGVHEYQVEGHSVVVIIQSKLTGFAYDLLVDGVSLTTGERGPQHVGNTSLQGAIFLAVFMILFGLGLSWYIKRDYDKQLVIQQWPTATGEITSINTDYHPDTSDDESSSNDYYHAVLTVDYIFEDNRFSTQLDDDEHFNSSNLAMLAHKVREKQALYVNPSQPQEAYLYFDKLAPNGWMGSVLIVMGMFTFMATLMIGVTWYRNR